MELKALSRLGWSVTAMAREYGLSRTTIYKELASPSPRHYQRAKPTALTEAQLVHVERRLTVCPNVRGTDLPAELRYEYGYDGGADAEGDVAVAEKLLRDPIQQLNALKNVLSGVANLVSALIFVAVAHVDWQAAGVIAVSSHRRPSRVGGRPPP